MKTSALKQDESRCEQMTKLCQEKAILEQKVGIHKKKMADKEKLVRENTKKLKQDLANALKIANVKSEVAIKLQGQLDYAKNQVSEAQERRRLVNQIPQLDDPSALHGQAGDDDQG